MLTAFTACEKDAPEINFSQSTTVTVDLTDVINAINSLSTSVDEKLKLIYEVINSSNKSLEEKIDVLKAAIETQTLELSNKLDVIQQAVENGITDLKEQQELTREALIASLEKEFAKNDSILEEGNKKFDDINKALTLIGVEEGILERSNRDTLFMQPTVWGLFNKDEELHAAFSNEMNITDMKVTAKPLSVSPIAAHSWNLDNPVTTPNKETLRLLALHSRQLTGEKSMVVAIRTYKSYTIEAGIPSDQNYTFTSQTGWQIYEKGTGYYYWGGGAGPTEEGRYRLTHTIADGNNKMQKYPTAYFVVASK